MPLCVLYLGVYVFGYYKAIWTSVLEHRLQWPLDTVCVHF